MLYDDYSRVIWKSGDSGSGGGGGDGLGGGNRGRDGRGDIIIKYAHLFRRDGRFEVIYVNFVDNSVIWIVWAYLNNFYPEMASMGGFSIVCASVDGCGFV